MIPLQSIVPMLALAWWGWLLAVFAGFIALCLCAMFSWRKGVRRRLIAHLAKTKPELRVTRETGHSIHFDSDKFGSGQINLHNLYRMLSDSKVSDTDKEPEVFDKFLAGLWEGLEQLVRPLSMAEDGEHILPRLVNAEHLAELRSSAQLPAVALGDTGLWVVFVRDSESAVAYINDTHFAELGVTLERLQEQAVENLLKKGPANFARAVVEKETLFVLKAGDTFDAARLLLVPGQLSAGEELVAIVPDRDTLALLPVPKDGDFQALTKMAETPAGPPLLNRPLRVSQRGFELLK